MALVPPQCHLLTLLHKVILHQESLLLLINLLVHSWTARLVDVKLKIKSVIKENSVYFHDEEVFESTTLPPSQSVR